MDDGLRVTDRLVVPAAELRERFSRSSGPGGQGVNTTDSRVELSFDLGGSPSVPETLRERALARLAGRLVGGVLTVTASEHRAQLANREAARERMAALLTPGGVFASFGGPLRLADPALRDAVAAARAEFLADDEIPSPDGTPPSAGMQWPGTELRASEWFADVRQSEIERRITISADDYIGLLSTVSAYLELPPHVREQVFRRVRDVLPGTVEVTADVTVHLARRTSPGRRSAGRRAGLDD